MLISFAKEAMRQNVQVGRVGHCHELLLPVGANGQRGGATDLLQRKFNVPDILSQDGQDPALHGRANIQPPAA